MKKRKREEREKKTVSAKNRLNNHSGGGFERTSTKLPEGFTPFRPEKAGTYRIDIIPYVTGEGNPQAEAGDVYFERTYFVHARIGPDKNTYVCARKTFGEKCPICDYRSKLSSDPEGNEKVIKSLAPKERQLWNVIDRDNKDAGIQIWDVSFHLFGKFLDDKIRTYVSEGDDTYCAFADLEKGKLLRVGAKSKKWEAVSFLEFNDIEFRDRPKPLKESLIEEAACLDDCLVKMDYKELKSIFMSDDSADEDEDDDKDDDDTDEDDELPKKKKKKPSKPSEDEEEDDEDEEEEDEDEAPKKKKKPSKDDDEEDEEDDDESDDEDDDPSAKDLGITVGCIVKHKEHGRCEVIGISKDGSSVYLEDDAGEEHREGIAPVECKLVKPAKTSKKSKDEDEDDEEDEAPKKKKKIEKKKSKKDEDWEDEDEDDDD